MVEIWFGILNQKCLKESFNSPESMYNAIYDFIHLWDTSLAHPFKWNYNGKGLYQKAVDRFIKMLVNSTAKMDVKFMTKQFLLMQNLIKTYQIKVRFDSWLKLYQAINTNLEQLNSVIIKDGGPKRMVNAKIALMNLIESLTIIVNTVNKISA